MAGGGPISGRKYGATWHWLGREGLSAKCAGALRTGAPRPSWPLRRPRLLARRGPGGRAPEPGAGAGPAEGRPLEGPRVARRRLRGEGRAGRGARGGERAGGGAPAPGGSLLSDRAAALARPGRNPRAGCCVTLARLAPSLSPRPHRDEGDPGRRVGRPPRCPPSAGSPRGGLGPARSVTPALLRGGSGWSVPLARLSVSPFGRAGVWKENQSLFRATAMPQ